MACSEPRRHPFDAAGFLRDPYRVYRQLRERGSVQPVSRPGHEGAGEYLVLGYDDVKAALGDERLSVNRLRADLFREAIEELPEDLRPENQFPSMLTVDPPHHTRLRKLVSRAFTPRRVEGLTPYVEKIAGGLLDEAARGEDVVDLVSAYAEPLPALVIAGLLGVPPEDHGRFRAWSHDLLGALVFEGSGARLDAFRRARESMRAYLRERIAERREEPRDDLLSDLVRARDERDALSDEELLATSNLLLVAGHETTTHLIASAVDLLLRHPPALEALRGDPCLLPGAVEEALRCESPFQAIARVASEPLELGGVRLPAGALLTLVLGAANRDPEVFPDPEAFDVERDPNPHLAFAHGVHFCLGASLARLEARVALGALLDRHPSIERAGACELRASTVVRGPRRLPVRLR